MRLQRVGIVLSVIILSVISFVSGVNITQNANSTSSSSILPISKGGTGKSSFTSEQVLIGNGANPLTSRAIDASPSAGSNNLITSSAVNSVNETAKIGAGLYNTYKELDWSLDPSGINYFILGKVPSTSASGDNYFLFIGDFSIFRSAQNGGTGNPSGLGSGSIYHSKLYINLIGVNSINSKAINIINDVNFRNGYSANYDFKLGTFTYNGETYLGGQLQVSALAGRYIINGFKENPAASLPDTCTPTQTVCFGKSLLAADVEDWIQYAPAPAG
jgi:hypothetical protein